MREKMCRECGCITHHHGRRFLTKSERVEKLRGYAEDLKKEIVAVEERIKELSG